jgi:cation:H+ antiporter
MALTLTFSGLVLLFFGGELLLRGAVAVALRFGLSPMLIGLTIVAFATSMPELLVTITAGLEGFTDVGIGNVVGSNVANILLILGVAAILKPIKSKPRLILRDTIAMVLASAVFIVYALLGEVGLLQGVAMLTILTIYLVLSYRLERQRGASSDEGDLLEDVGKRPYSLPMAGVLMAIGLAGLCLGSQFLIEGAVDLAKAAGVSDTVIGLTLVAVGTSLPELATAIVAGMRGHSDVALGNVLGSNIMNILLIVGILAIITPFHVATEVLNVDMWIMGAVSLLLLPVLIIGKGINRLGGGFFLLLYVGFIGYQLLSGKVPA